MTEMTATKATHTPGPWIIRRMSAGQTLYISANGKGVIADLSSFDAPEANANLIAAAPLLLEALTDLLNVIATDALIPDSVSYMRQARKALAVAVGADVQEATPLVSGLQQTGKP